LQLAALVGLGLVVAGVLTLKSQLQPTPAPPAGQQASPSVSTGATAPAASGQSQLPEAQLDQLMARGQPTLAFFHSNTCDQCIQMTEIVNQVYPAFSQSVALVDVNVYDERNANLLSRAGIRVIPTLIFFNQQGQGQMTMGVMQPEQFRQQLQMLSGS
jgi:thioredoxin-like negative regulator of GroEL